MFERIRRKEEKKLRNAIFEYIGDDDEEVKKEVCKMDFKELLTLYEMVKNTGVKDGKNT